MKVEIKKIRLENYKCFADEEVEFSHRTIISGKNRQGKSTIQNAYLETLTGKEIDGSAPDSVRPHDEAGHDIPKVDVIREITLEIDEKPTVIKKKTFQKWRRPRGKTEEVFDGNGESFEIDGYPYKLKDYRAYISNIADEDTMLLCSNPNVFLNILRKSTSDARKLLEKLSGFDYKAFVESKPKYEKAAEITDGHTVEDTLKKLRRQLSVEKKNIEAQNGKIKHEQSRPLIYNEISRRELEKMRADLEKSIPKIDALLLDLKNSTKYYNELENEILQLKHASNRILTEASKSFEEEKRKIQKRLGEKKNEKYNVGCSLSMLKNKLLIAEKDIERGEENLKRLREDYVELAGKEYSEARLHEIESEQFDEGSLICPTCGQTFPEEKQRELMERFEAGKKDRIAAEEKRRNNFYIQQDEELDSITLAGNQAKEALAKAKESKEKTEKEIEKTLEDIKSVDDEIEKITKEVNSLPSVVDLSTDDEYMKITLEIQDKEKRLSEMDNGEARRSELNRKKTDLLQEITKISDYLKAADLERQSNEKILNDLQKQLREMSQNAAFLERDIGLLCQFSMEKNAEISKILNKNFSHFQFNFLDWTIEGNPVETCELICDGTSYFNGLNSGDKKLCEIDLCRGFQKMNGLNLPIFCDEANTIDPERIPADMPQQLILIKRDDNDLKVEGI